MPDKTTQRNWHLHAVLLALWFVFSFGIVFFARDLSGTFFSWPLAYWLTAQGALLVFIAIVVVFALVANRRSPEVFQFDSVEYGSYTASLRRRFFRFCGWFVVVFGGFGCGGAVRLTQGVGSRHFSVRHLGALCGDWRVCAHC